MLHLALRPSFLCIMLHLHNWTHGYEVYDIASIYLLEEGKTQQLASCVVWAVLVVRFGYSFVSHIIFHEQGY